MDNISAKVANTSDSTRLVRIKNLKQKDLELEHSIYILASQSYLICIKLHFILVLP